MSGDAWVNTDAGFLGGPDEVGSARDRVLKIQAKLHLWAKSDPDRRFGDLFNLVADPAFLIEAWVRVRGNKGARSAGVDGQTAYSVESERGTVAFLGEVRAGLPPGSWRVSLRPRPVGRRSGSRS